MGREKRGSSKRCRTEEAEGKELIDGMSQSGVKLPIQVNDKSQWSCFVDVRKAKVDLGEEEVWSGRAGGRLAIG